MGERVIMSREILFKAKRKDNGEWVEGYYLPGMKLPGYDGKNDFIVMSDGDYFAINPITLCQYTGLMDKDGRKIWENDIVNCWTCIDIGDFANYRVEIGYVEMNYGSFGLHRIQDDTYYRPFKDYFEGYNLHIIGNIFDNPELLEVE